MLRAAAIKGSNECANTPFIIMTENTTVAAIDKKRTNSPEAKHIPIAIHTAGWMPATENESENRTVHVNTTAKAIRRRRSEIEPRMENLEEKPKKRLRNVLRVDFAGGHKRMEPLRIMRAAASGWRAPMVSRRGSTDMTVEEAFMGVADKSVYGDSGESYIMITRQKQDCLWKQLKYSEKDVAEKSQTLSEGTP